MPMMGTLLVAIVLGIAVGCLWGYGAGRNRAGTVTMKLGQHNLAYLMDDSSAQPVNREARRARKRS
ncbi:MAG: hypothetical protein KGL39_23080 [Patescibacteria group bacterium]|nr:hypothetical protein [Patescibacteria group bacterium]